MDINQAYEMLISVNSNLKNAFYLELKSWAPESPPVTTMMSLLADSIMSQFSEFTDEEYVSVFRIVETLLANGDEVVKNSIKTGFLETFMHSDDPVNSSRFTFFLGERAKAYCLSWDEFTGVKTIGLYSDLSNGEILCEDRKGWALNCPNCDAEVKYTALNVVGGEDLFFYSNKNSDVVLREEDRRRAKIINSNDELFNLYSDIETRLSTLDNGSQFKLSNNVCCPHCGEQFPYKFNADSQERLYESKIIWVEGATIFRGAYEPSNKLGVVDVS